MYLYVLILVIEEANFNVISTTEVALLYQYSGERCTLNTSSKFQVKRMFNNLTQTLSKYYIQGNQSFGMFRQTCKFVS
jgi:hypothetical protein